MNNISKNGEFNQQMYNTELCWKDGYANVKWSFNKNANYQVVFQQWYNQKSVECLRISYDKWQSDAQ